MPDEYLLSQLLTGFTDAERAAIASAREDLHEMFKAALYSGDDDTKLELLMLLHAPPSGPAPDPGCWDLT